MASSGRTAPLLFPCLSFCIRDQHSSSLPVRWIDVHQLLEQRTRSANVEVERRNGLAKRVQAMANVALRMQGAYDLNSVQSPLLSGAGSKGSEIEDSVIKLRKSGSEEVSQPVLYYVPLILLIEDRFSVPARGSFR